MITKFKTLVLPRLKAFTAAISSAAGAGVVKYIEDGGKLTKTGLLGAAILGVAVYIGTWAVPNKTPA